MKVVLFCGGFGMRIREYSDSVPKPLVPIGSRPILWHLMRYYAHFGFKDFILCLGYGAERIKEYFLDYNECLTNDFVIEQGGAKIELFRRDIADWRITFVDTGLNTNIGGRLRKVRSLLEGEEFFLANYADGLSDIPLDEYVAYARSENRVAMFLSVTPPHVFNVVSTDSDNLVTSIEYMDRSDLRMNGGFFVLRQEIFDHMQPGEELVEQPFKRLIERRELLGYRYDGFWASMDTFKDRQRLEELYASAEAPWAIWEAKD